MNWTRRKLAWMACARVFTDSVFARPGTPSSSTWPFASRPISRRSTRYCWPTMTVAISSAQAIGEGRSLAHALVDGGDAGVHATEFDSGDRAGGQPQRRRDVSAPLARDASAGGSATRLRRSPARARARTSPAAGGAAARARAAAVRAARPPRRARPCVRRARRRAPRPSTAPTTPAFVTQARAVARSTVGKHSVLSAVTAIVMPDSKKTRAANDGNSTGVR